MNKTQLVAQIRFAISQLAARNAHHEFEHVCRELARVRICGNILPATGPVSAGGDQSRDFETFRSYLDNSDLAYRSFVGRISNGPIAFACSIQRDDLSTKIRSDVNNIMRSGTRVIGIHYFLAENLAISKRHVLQAWANNDHEVHLEIYDANAISELLAESDIFWIAVHYLNIPAESYPTEELKDNPAWYHELLQHWRNNEGENATSADFYDFKRAIRAATYKENLKPDLPFWLKRIATFEDDQWPVVLRRKACYEISVAMLRGQGSMIGREQCLRNYFSFVPSLELPADLEDATVLAAFCIGAEIKNATQLNKLEIIRFQRMIIERLNVLLERESSPNLRCCYLQTRGYAELHNCAEQITTCPLNLDPVFENWNMVADEAHRAPLFPLERFSNLLTQFAEIAGTDSRFRLLTTRVDSLVSARVGGIIAAEIIRDRALVFYDKGHILRAIDELHRVKISWFRDESLHGCCLSLLMLSQWYLQLGLTFAGKYYAFASVQLAFQSPHDSLKRFLPRGIVAASDCAYQQGCWFDFMTLVEVGMFSRTFVSSTYRGSGSDNDFQRALYHCIMIELAAERFDKGIAAVVRSRRTKWGIEEWFNELVPEARVIWSQLNDEEYWCRLQELSARPFSDTGQRRVVNWHQLGLLWSIEWDNTYASTVKAEQFIALLQILLSVMSTTDFCLPQSDVIIEFCLVDDIVKPVAQIMPSNKSRHWQVKWPSAVVLDNPQDIFTPMHEALAVATTIIFDLSFLPRASFANSVDQLFKDGLETKVCFVRSFESLYRALVPESSFDTETRRSAMPIKAGQKFSAAQHSELVPKFGLGPGYTKAGSEENIVRRYDRCHPLVKFTLERLNRTKQFRDTVRQLRTDGWRDWHILLALTNAVMNYKARRLSFDSVREFQNIHARIAEEIETSSSPEIPLSEVTIERLRMSLEMSAWATLKSYGLECHQPTPDIPATMAFLAQRYNYWSDDVAHVPLFDIAINEK